MAELQIAIPQNAIAEFCERNHIRKLSAFGSALRNDFGPASDIDLLVEFDVGYSPGWNIVALQDELSMLLGRPVDLRTPQELSRHFRESVLAQAQIIYERS